MTNFVDNFKKINWKNEDITNYYANISINVLTDFAIMAGLEDGCDLDLIYPYIAKAQTIADVGSGYGRVIKYLINKGYKGEVCAVEGCKNFCVYLKQHYSGKVSITHSDIQNFKPLQKVDVILWLWSGINDFAKEEHLPVLRHLCSWLKVGGILIIETLLHTLAPVNASINYEKEFVILSEHGTLYNYKTSKEEIKEYAMLLNFQHVRHIHYVTTTQRQRILHILS